MTLPQSINRALVVALAVLLAVLLAGAIATLVYCSGHQGVGSLKTPGIAEPLREDATQTPGNSADPGAIALPAGDSALLPTPFIDQLAADAPMGCEAAALLQALHTKGYATQYNLALFLLQMPLAEDDNPHHGFSFTPYEELGEDCYQGIFAAPLAAWGTQYGDVADISGASLDELKQELLSGNPVVVFVTQDFATPEWQDWWFGPAVNNAHVMTLAGFENSTGQVYLVDPHRGPRWVDQNVFLASYLATAGAVVVR
ncbi:MAG: C39 family peptidase [Coriobacteriales bacterium]|jgi:uncharacterized protein YvpB|nr:C39 family peptidase [Coriobacteriales bacterium]